MERKIGEIFEYNGEWYQCINTGNCSECAFTGKRCYDFSTEGVDIIGDCNGRIFKKLEKVGEPYMAHDHSRNKDVVVQDYKLYNQHACYTGHEEMLSFGLCGKVGMVTIKSKEPIKSLNCENSVEIEIKETKEDMEEKNNGNTPLNVLTDKYVNGDICYDDFEKKVKALYSCKEEIKPTLKEFDLEAAKAGKPVCTRDGRKARIICFDRISGDDYYKIVACVTAFDGDFEEVIVYGIDGYIVDSQNPKDEDLMMLPEKKEGWVNVYDADTTFRFVEGMVYNTKDEAIQRAKEEVTNGQREKGEYVDTVKICWEE